ncbi:MAG: carboxypeptidase regulatory-like domain-containing protein [bacterium]
MEKLRIIVLTMLALVTGVAFFTSAQAQDVQLVLTPKEVHLGLGESVKFEVFASAAGRNLVRIDSLDWRVSPDSMGTITEDGFFIAGRNIGKAEVTVTAYIGDLVLEKSASVKIGRIFNAFIDVAIEPESAVVPPGQEQQFRVTVSSAAGNVVLLRHVRWDVEPEDLGKISERGLFKAANQINQGKVIALVDIDGLTLRATAEVTVSPLPTGAISGTVLTDPDAAPIPDAKVKAIRLGNINWVKSATSDDQGNYLVGDLIPGHYVVYAKARGFIGEFFNDTRNYLEAEPVQVAEEDTVAEINFNLTEGGKITGQVFADIDSLPLAGAHVKAILAVAEGRLTYHAVTNDDGAYEIDSLPTGFYFVKANAPGFKAEFFDDAEDESTAELVSITAPEVKDGIDFGLATKSAISGRVTSSVDGTPIVDALVKVFTVGVSVDNLAHFVLKDTRTDENGEYIIQVRPGQYYVHASAEGFNGEFFDDAKQIADATLVGVEPDQHTTGIDFALDPRGSISGTVTDQVTEQPIAGAAVQAFLQTTDVAVASSPDVVGFRAETDDQGNYTIENLPAGKYIVRAVAEGYLPEFFEEKARKDEATILAIEDNTQLTGIDFTLEMGGSISGQVASALDSLPIADALVQVWEADSDFHRRAYTNDDGAYTVKGLRTGSYVVQVIAEGFFSEFFDNVRNRDEATLVEVVSPNDTSGIDFFLEPFAETKGTIAGRVTSEKDEAAILGALVIAVSPEDLFPHITFTGPRGNYHLTNLNPGKYFVFSWAFGFIGEFYDDAKVFREADPVFVEAGSVTDGINFALTPLHRPGLHTIRGQVRSAETGDPIAGVLVHGQIENDVQVNAVTNSDGNFLLADVPAGTYKIRATGIGYADGYFGGSSVDNAATVAVGNGQDAQNINLNLDRDEITDVESEDGSASVPEKFALLQNYPNPFNPETSINYQLPKNSPVTLKIYNILGQEIRTLIDKKQAPGTYSVKWDGKDNFGRPVASGIYIYQLKAGDNTKLSRRMLMIK